jgi:hypothetical protein
MADWKQPLRTVLCEHLPTTIADVIVQRLAEKISRETSGDIHSPDQILTEVARWLKVYLKPDKATDCLNHLRSIWNTRQPEVSTASFITEVIQNGDVVRIRQQASRSN